MTSRDQRLRIPARVLLMIARSPLAEDVRLALNHGHYDIRLAPTLEDASTLMADWRPHLIVLDMDTAAGEILDQLATNSQGPLPVVALTRRADLESKITAFERGVDDILTVPFSPEEFVARVLAIMRRTFRDPAVFSPVLRISDLEIDIVNRRVRVGETELHLTPLEQSLLYLLAANAGRLLSRNEILDYLWGTDYVAESNIVDRHIHNLRVKLQQHSLRPRCIATVSGRGYRFLSTPADAPPLARPFDRPR